VQGVVVTVVMVTVGHGVVVLSAQHISLVHPVDGHTAVVSVFTQGAGGHTNEAHVVGTVVGQGVVVGTVVGQGVVVASAQHQCLVHPPT